MWNKFIGAVLLVFSGCAQMQKYAYDYSMAKGFDVSKTRKVANLPVRELVKGLTSSNMNSLSEYLTMELMKVPSFTLIERQKINEILEEQEFGASGIVDPETATHIGKMVGADAVGFASVTDFEEDKEFGDYTITVFFRLVDCSTGEILYYVRARGGGFDINLALEEAASNAVKPLKEVKNE